MATRPGEPGLLGKFFDYPQGATTGEVAPYWLASSPGSGHRVRMTGACKKAFLATIEAVIERALAPANCGTFPAADTNFKNIDLDANGMVSLIAFTRWNTAADRSGLGARLVRGCPLGDWRALVGYVAGLWNSGSVSIPCGTVYAWQMEMLDYETGGWKSETDGHLDITDMTQLLDLYGYYADEDAFLYGVPSIRPWGLFPGGNMLTPVTDWVARSLTALGANVDTGSGTAMAFAEEQLNGSPAPLKAGHMGNWFDSSDGHMTGQSPSSRRSSSAWAVLQAMLANMRFTHLLFPYEVEYDAVLTTWTIIRIVEMDEYGDIVATEYRNDESTSTSTTTTDLAAHTDWLLSGSGTPYVEFAFYCEDVWIDENNPLVETTYPSDTDGWKHIGSSIMPYISIVNSYPASATLEIRRDDTTGIHSITAGNGQAYPSVGMQQYIDQYGGVTFIDAESHYSGPVSERLDWTKYSVRKEAGSSDLSSSVRAHASWLMSQLPSTSWPSVPSCPGVLTNETDAFWNGWEVRYPATPNVQVGGVDAYFPTRIRNTAFVTDNGWPIEYNLVSRTWEGSGDAVLPPPGVAFPGLDLSNYGPKLFKITHSPHAMAAYKWQFKAMTA